MNRVLLSSERMSWNTPRELLDAILEIDEIDVDPCSNELSIVPAFVHVAPRAWDWARCANVSAPAARGDGAPPRLTPDKRLLMGDGLGTNWSSLLEYADRPGRVARVLYVNPEYGRALPDWTAKSAAEVRVARRPMDVYGLVPSRTDTNWFHDSCGTARAICLWKGRLKFLGALDQAPFPSAVVYWGTKDAERADRFREVMSSRGLVVVR